MITYNKAAKPNFDVEHKAEPTSELKAKVLQTQQPQQVNTDNKTNNGGQI